MSNKSESNQIYWKRTLQISKDKLFVRVMVDKMVEGMDHQMGNV
jgi:hypothetical protein